MNLCRGCGQDFGSGKAFAAHRVGRHAYTLWEGLQMDPPHEDGRRCLTVDELRAKGFAQNSLGRWSLAQDLERGAAFKAARESGT